VPVVASAGLGRMTIVVLVLYWHFFERFDDCRKILVNVERVLIMLTYV